MNVALAPNGRLILAFQKQTKNTSSWSGGFSREFHVLWRFLVFALLPFVNQCFSKETLWKSFCLWCLKQRISKSEKNHEKTEKTARTMIRCFLFATEKQESTVYLVPGQLSFSVRYDFFRFSTLCTAPGRSFIS